MKPLIKETLIKYSKTSSRIKMAKLLNLPYNNSMQDWEIEVSHPKLISSIITIFETSRLDDDDKFVLMQILIASADELFNDNLSEFEKKWPRIELCLRENRVLYASIIHYWAWDYPVEENPAITIQMRMLWDEIIDEIPKS